VAREDWDDHKRRVLSVVNIADVVRAHVELKRSGTSLKGLCPFHREKTPSFHVYEDRGFFKCFGCGKGGDAITFLRETEGLEFIEALERLSAMANIPMPARRQLTEEERREREGRDAVEEQGRKLMDEAVAFYTRHLERAPVVRSYATGRGITDDDVKTWRMGYAPDGWTNFLDWAIKAGFAQSLVVSMGLAIEKREPGSAARCYDRFRNRLMFTITDAKGKPVAFGARAIKPDDEPKYLNSPETPLYKKGEMLFGFSLARQAMREKNRVMVVEGYMDAIATRRAGIHEVVATCGTALTPDQARLLRRMAEHVLFVYDGDAAGQNAMRRGCAVLLGAGLRVSIVSLPGEHDPDSLVKAEGPKALHDALERATDSIEHFLQAKIAVSNLDSPPDRVAIVDSVLELIGAVEDDALRYGYLQRTAQLSRLPLPVVQDRLAQKVKPAPQHHEPEPPEAEHIPVPPDADRAPVAPLPDEPVVERALLRVLISHPTLRLLAREKLDGRVVTTSWIRATIEAINRDDLPSDSGNDASLVEWLRSAARLNAGEANRLMELMVWRNEEFASPSAEMLEHLLARLAMASRRRHVRQQVAAAASPDTSPGLAEIHVSAVAYVAAARDVYKHPDGRKWMPLHDPADDTVEELPEQPAANDEESPF